MAMSPQAMCRAIQDRFENFTDSIDWENGERPHNEAYIELFDQGLTEYVEENMEIEYGWSAALPPPASTSDPVTSFSSRLVIHDKRIGQPQSVNAWGTLIRACFSRAVIQHPPAFANVTPGSLLTLTPLTIAPPPGEYPAPLLNTCAAIYTWLLGCINPAQLPGNHGSFIGATTSMVIR